MADDRIAETCSKALSDRSEALIDRIAPGSSLAYRLVAIDPHGADDASAGIANGGAGSKPGNAWQFEDGRTFARRMAVEPVRAFAGANPEVLAMPVRRRRGGGAARRTAGRDEK